MAKTKLLLLFSLGCLNFLCQQVIAEETCPIRDLALTELTKIRRLEVKKSIPCKRLNKKEIRSYLESALNKKATPERLELERRVLVTLKLIPKDYKYQEELLSLYTDQVGGFYDPEQEYFAAASWIPENLQVPIAFHELTHALQDQNFDLDTFTDSKLSTDELLARSALAEGDASITMILAGQGMSGKEGEDKLTDQELKTFVSMTLSSTQANQKLVDTPKAIRAMLVFPYTKGSEYVHKLMREGGWDKVNSKYKVAPKGTAEILGFEVAELTGGDRVKLSCSKISKGSEVIYEDTLGALYLGYVLGKDGVSGKIDDFWAGDRLCVFGEEGREKLVWVIKPNGKSDDLVKGLRKRLGKGAGDEVSIEDKGGFIGVGMGLGG